MGDDKMIGIGEVMGGDKVVELVVIEVVRR